MDVSRVSLRRYYIVICMKVTCRKKRDAFGCTGAGLPESDAFVSVFHWD